MGGGGSARSWRSRRVSAQRCDRCRRSRGSRWPGRRPRCRRTATCGQAMSCTPSRTATWATASTCASARGWSRSTTARGWWRRTCGRSAAGSRAWSTTHRRGGGGGGGGGGMITLDALQPRLRQLKLSGLRDAIGSRAEEARTRGLDPLEFLALLLDDELARREADGLDRRIRQARFEEFCDLRDFDFGYNPEIPKARIWELASGRFIEEHAAVVLRGPTGVGKSFVAQALGVQACRHHHSVLFAKTSAFLTDLAGGRADGDGSYQPRLRRYLSPRVLILDDFAMREYTVLQTEDLYELVSRRHRRGPLIVPTNPDR